MYSIRTIQPEIIPFDYLAIVYLTILIFCILLGIYLIRNPSGSIITYSNGYRGVTSQLARWTIEINRLFELKQNN